MLVINTPFFEQLLQELEILKTLSPELNVDINLISEEFKKSFETFLISNLISDNDLLNIEEINESKQDVSGDGEMLPEAASQERLYNFPSWKEILVSRLSEICAGYIPKHYDYSMLAGRLCIQNLHRHTLSKFSDVLTQIYEEENILLSPAAPPSNASHLAAHSEIYELSRPKILDPGFYNWVQKNKEEIDSWLLPLNDFKYDYLSYKTLSRSYLFKIGDKIIERPQHMLLRVALGIHYSSHFQQQEEKAALASTRHTYELLSRGLYTHASPTLFHAGTKFPQMASCFLIDIHDDSIIGIYKTLSDCALISKYTGGIGVAIHKIRAKGSVIAGTNGKSNGIVPMLRVYNSTARYVDQGGGKRKGAIACYLEPWHADILDFLDLKKNTGTEEQRAKDLFYALWIPDLFMERVEKNQNWSLFCPGACPGLDNVHSKQFEDLYLEYENKNLAVHTIPARALYIKIITSQIETGGPYMLFKDTINKTSNQQNLGTIKSSNLCAEICQYTDSKEISVCNLASICLPNFVVPVSGPNSAGFVAASRLMVFDHFLLGSVVKTIVQNLNKLIDRSYYPVPEASNSNLKHRPMGIGIQGLANVFAMLKIPFDSDEAMTLNREIMETIYFNALTESNNQAVQYGVYEQFNGSPLSKGMFNFDLYKSFNYSLLNGRWDWEDLRQKIKSNGVRNSLLVALMPTATTSQIMGYVDAFEPFPSNMYIRRLLSGEFIVVNKHLVQDLMQLNLWSEEFKNLLLLHNGSVQNLNIPQHLKNLYKTAFEISPKVIINMARDRQFFVDQSQSMNIFISNPDISTVSNMHMYSWKQGLKTGLYYLRTKPMVNSVKFTLTPEGPMKAGTTGHEAPAVDETGAICCPAFGGAPGGGGKRFAPRIVKQTETNDDDREACMSCNS